jgi:cleavage and polyadenylation specificity factor subunit 1
VQQLASTSPAGGTLIWLKDEVSGQLFLADTGAARSVFPHKSTAAVSGPALVAADGRPIPAWGNKQLTLQFGQRKFQFSFILAGVATPIIGLDFLAAHRLFVDAAAGRVLHGDTMLPVDQPPAQPTVAAKTSPVAAVSTVPPEVQELLNAFPNITAAADDSGAWPKPLHGVEHYIETSGRPVTAKPRRLDPEKLRIAEEEFKKLEAAGIVRRSKSPWASPLHMVPKADGSWRPCGDYRRLNNLTVPDQYPLPNLQDMSSRMDGCTVFSKIDLVKGYHQVPVAESDIPKTAIITPFGLFEYVYMPFGLRNAAQTFQRLMDHIFRDLPSAFTYLDDNIVFSKSRDTHLCDLNNLFEVLSENGLRINPDKCEFMKSELDFLGHHITADGVAPMPSHVEAIEQFPPPSEVKQLQRFLGMVNFYRRFIPGVARILKPLTDALAGGAKSLDWSATHQAAFEAAKAALIKAVPLQHPDPAAELVLATDASDTHIGGVLQQKKGASLRPLAFFSKKLDKTQRRYHTFDRELLAAYLTIRHFRFLLEGRHFTLMTNHKPLVAALQRVSPPWSAKQQRQLAYIAEFTSTVVHVAGPDNVVADALSRPDPTPPPTPRVPPAATAAVVDPAAQPSPVDFEEMAREQVACPEVGSMKASSTLQLRHFPQGDYQLFGDVSTGKFRPLVPVTLRRRVFDNLHGGGHPGRRATRRLISARFVWPGLSKQVTAWAKECMACQRGKVYRHVHLQAEPITVPSRRFAHLHVDLVGPLPPSRGFTYLFTMIDRTTRWAEAVPLAAITAADCAKALAAGWIARFGVPDVITSDRGAQFTSTLWASLCNILNITRNTTTAFHPQANGMVERWHRRLKDALRARAAAADWADHLPWVLLALRAAPHEDSAASPAESVYGAQLVLPGEFLGTPEAPTEAFLERVRAAAAAVPVQPAQHKVAADKKPPAVLPADLMAARMVLVRVDGHKPPLAPLYNGPYLVLQRSLHHFTIQMGAKEEVVSVHRLKPAFTTPEAQPALPPRRGRPPAQPAATTPPRPARPAKRVTFQEEVQFFPSATPPARERPLRATRRPARYQDD